MFQSPPTSHYPIPPTLSSSCSSFDTCTPWPSKSRAAAAITWRLEPLPSWPLSAEQMSATSRKCCLNGLRTQGKSTPETIDVS